MLSRFDTGNILASALKRSLEIKKQERCEGSLLEFIKFAWPIVDPATPFVDGYVIESIADHLEAVTRGHIKKLIMNVPPGCSKSTSLYMWSAWEWGPKNLPHMRYICASYNQALSERDNLRCRRVVEHDSYQKLWGDRVNFDRAQHSKIKFENSQTGWRQATSVTGGVMGHRADRVLIDDPNNPNDMESETVRRTTNTWFTEVVPDRLNNMKESAIVLIQQRLHEADVTGTAIARDMGFTYLVIPLEYEPKLYVNGYTVDEEDGREVIRSFFGEDTRVVAESDIFWRDWRTEPNENAWPERFSPRIIEGLKRDKGNAYHGQYQQYPVPRGGSVIKEEYWEIWEDPKYPPFEFIVAALDTAFTEDEHEGNDPSAMTIWGLWREKMPDTPFHLAGSPRLMLIYAWAEYLALHDLVEKVIDVCTVDKRITPDRARFPVDRLLIEQSAAGMPVYQELERLIGFQGKFGIELIPATKSKLARTHSVEHIFSNGMVWKPNKSFADKVVDQCKIFPYGAHDDLHDTVTMALRWYRDCGFMPNREEEQESTDRDLAYRPRLPPLYGGW